LLLGIEVLKRLHIPLARLLILLFVILIAVQRLMH